jgi:two-component system, OmpR family, sensor histidine kinase KdpD
MDLDAIIARGPQIALVDELAHTDAPGSRHPKRYLDVEELLSHGIDVYSTVNIQHIESLNDVVAQITHVRVRAAVPDSVFDCADAVELVDLTPDDLIQRLKEGKVYVPPMHGTISAANRTDRKCAVSTIRLPVPAHAKRLDTAA